MKTESGKNKDAQKTDEKKNIPRKNKKQRKQKTKDRGDGEARANEPSDCLSNLESPIIKKKVCWAEEK